MNTSKGRKTHQTRKELISMKKNITRVDALNLAIAALSENADAVEVLTSIRDTIAKANSRKSDKPTKTQVENAGIKAELLTHITAEG